jgi:predicted esterase
MLIKKTLILLTSGLSLSSVRADYLPVTYDANGYFHLDSGQSAYVGYKPDTYSDSKPISLLIWLHGCGADTEGDLSMVAPPSSRQTQSYIAISIGGRDGDCWSVDTDTPKVLAALVDVAKHFNINPRKVYLGGYSSGGDLAYRVGFQHSSLFAGLLVENSDPFQDTGLTQSSALASASWKINIAHLAHSSDETYHIANVRAHLNTLTANGFPVTLIEKSGSSYDPDTSSSGTTYDLIHFLLPYIDAGWESPKILLSVANAANPQLSFTVTGANAANCIVQAATNLSSPSWTTLATNQTPFTFTDTNTSLSHQRFYRALISP